MIRIDSREQREPIVALHNAPEPRRLLEYRLPNDPAAYSYDALVEWDGGSLKVEIKQWGDYQSTWFAGRLERQVSAVDVFIVEDDPMLAMADMPNDEKAAAAWRRNRANAELHLATMALQLPVVRTSGIYQTIEVLRKFDESKGGTVVRTNRTAKPKDSPRMAILNAFPGLNPYRRLPDGRLLGDAIWEDLVSPPGLAISLGVEDWAQMPGVGSKLVQRALATLGVEGSRSLGV